MIQGFYSTELGDSEIEGMAEIPDQFFGLIKELASAFGLIMA